MAKPRGYIYAAAISRWAMRLHSIIVERADDEYPQILELVDGVEASGIVPPVTHAGFTGFAHTPDQLRTEIIEAGLELEGLVGLEGLAFALSDVDERMDDSHQRALLLDQLRATETVPDLLGLSTHLLATTRSAAERVVARRSPRRVKNVSRFGTRR